MARAAPSGSPGVGWGVEPRTHGALAHAECQWYEQRIAVDKNAEAVGNMANAQEEEFKHFGMVLEFLLRQKPKWRATLPRILFKTGDIVELGKKGEDAGENTP